MKQYEKMEYSTQPPKMKLPERLGEEIQKPEEIIKETHKIP
jgi:hypothetical protein